MVRDFHQLEGDGVFSNVGESQGPVGIRLVGRTNVESGGWTPGAAIEKYVRFTGTVYSLKFNCRICRANGIENKDDIFVACSPQNVGYNTHVNFCRLSFQ